VLQRLIRVRLRETPLNQVVSTERALSALRRIQTPRITLSDHRRSMRQSVVERFKPNPMGINCLHFKLSSSGGLGQQGHISRLPVARLNEDFDRDLKNTPRDLKLAAARRKSLNPTH